MAFAPGLFTVCVSCKGTDLPTDNAEVADLIDDVIIGTQKCRACGQAHMYARRPTVDEMATIRRHQDKIVNIENRQQMPLAELVNRDDPKLF